MRNRYIQLLDDSMNTLLGKRRGGPIVLHKYRAVYFPIPKVACSSMIKFCANVLNLKEGPDTDIHKLFFPSLKLKNLYRYDAYYKFAFVRNPWDRLLSCYSNKISSNPQLNNRYYVDGVARSFTRYQGVFRAGMPFAEFVHIVKDWPDETSDPHFRSQHVFLEDASGELVTDFIGRFESLADDFEHIATRLGIEDDMLPHLKKSAHKDYRDYYNDDLAKVVAQRYTRDIELFHYRFD